MLPTASELDNNWGDAGTFTRIVLSDYLGDDAGFEAAIGKWRQLMDLVAADGHIPEEVARGRAGLGYTQEALDYKVAVGRDRRPPCGGPVELCRGRGRLSKTCRRLPCTIYDRRHRLALERTRSASRSERLLGDRLRQVAGGLV